jgi:hypothetical protein
MSSEFRGTGQDGTLPPPMNLVGIPTAACPVCGCTWLMTAVCLDPDSYEISSWRLQGAHCHDCGTLVTLACPPDHPDFRPDLV